MITSYLLTAFLVLFSLVVHYEAVMLARAWMARWQGTGIRHGPVAIAMSLCLMAHGLQIWGFGVGYYLLANVLELGTFGGEIQAGGFVDYVYFSAVTYTSLGVGDLFPQDHLRLMAGVEALIGLMLIGWTSFFTYEAVSNHGQEG